MSKKGKMIKSAARRIARQDVKVNGVHRGAPILKSNSAINPEGGLFNAMAPVTNFLKGGVEGIKESKDTYSRIAKNAGKNAKMLNIGKQTLKEVYTNKDGTYNMKKIAGSYMVAAGTARLATGGGLYKDGDGETNIVGVPFI